MHTRLNTTGPSRRAAVASAALAIAGLGVIATVSMTGSAQAERPEITANSLDPTITAPPHTFQTIPPLTLLTVPPHTFVTDSSVDFETTTTTETTTTLETTTTASTEAPVTTQGGGPALPSAEPGYTVEINVAQVNCDGTIHVEYATTADPAPAGPAHHVVVYNPTSSPAELTVFETEGNPSNGSFAFDEPGVTDVTYRLLVIGLFEPANPDGPKAIDQAEVALAVGC